MDFSTTIIFTYLWYKRNQMHQVTVVHRNERGKCLSHRMCSNFDFFCTNPAESVKSCHAPAILPNGTIMVVIMARYQLLIKNNNVNFLMEPSGKSYATELRFCDAMPDDATESYIKKSEMVSIDPGYELFYKFFIHLSTVALWLIFVIYIHRTLDCL